MHKLISSIVKGELVDWGLYINREIENCWRLYVAVGWCKVEEGQSELKKYQLLLSAIERVHQNIEQVLDAFILRKPDLRRFMVLHSVFPTDYNTNRDWLQGYMAKRLMPTNEDVTRWLKTPELPADIGQALAGFDPIPLSEHMDMDNVRIEYKMFGNFSIGESDDPINVVDIDWEKHNLVNIAEIIKEMPQIDLRVDARNSPEHMVSPTGGYLANDDDLPF